MPKIHVTLGASHSAIRAETTVVWEEDDGTKRDLTSTFRSLRLSTGLRESPFVEVQNWAERKEGSAVTRTHLELLGFGRHPNYHAAVVEQISDLAEMLSFRLSQLEERLNLEPTGDLPETVETTAATDEWERHEPAQGSGE